MLNIVLINRSDLMLKPFWIVGCSVHVSLSTHSIWIWSTSQINCFGAVQCVIKSLFTITDQQVKLNMWEEPELYSDPPPTRGFSICAVIKRFSADWLYSRKCLLMSSWQVCTLTDTRGRERQRESGAAKSTRCSSWKLRPFNQYPECISGQFKSLTLDLTLWTVWNGSFEHKSSLCNYNLMSL